MTRTQEQVSYNAGAFFAGLLVGGAAAVLFAPMTGCELRTELKKKAKEGREVLAGAVDQAVDSAQSLADQGAALIERSTGRIRAEGDRVVAAVVSGMDAARQAYGARG